MSTMCAEAWTTLDSEAHNEGKIEAEAPFHGPASPTVQERSYGGFQRMQYLGEGIGIHRFSGDYAVDSRKLSVCFRLIFWFSEWGMCMSKQHEGIILRRFGNGTVQCKDQV